MQRDVQGSEELEQSVRAVRRLACVLVRDEARADDLAQEAWLAALRAKGGIRGPLLPWLAGTMRRLRLHAGRGEARRAARELHAAQPEALQATDEMLARAELGEQLFAAVRALPEPYRGTLLLRYLEDRSPGEVAALQGASESTVRTRTQRGLVMLRARLEVREGGMGALLPMLKALAAPEAVKAAVPGVALSTALRVGLGCAGLVLMVWTLHEGLPIAPAHGSELEDAPSPFALAAPRLEADAMPILALGRSVPARAGAEPPVAVAESFAIEGIVRDEAGEPIPDAIVTAEGPTGESWTDVAGDHGEYGFLDLSAGVWTLSAKAPKRVGRPHRFELAGSARTIALDLALQGEPVLAVYLRTSDGEPYFGALKRTDSGETWRIAHDLTWRAALEGSPRKRAGSWHAESGPDGRVGEFRSLELEGELRVSVQVRSHVFASQIVRARDGRVDLVLDPSTVIGARGSVSARFVDGHGAPVEGLHAMLACERSFGRMGPVSDAEGLVHYAQLTPGDYQLSIAKGGVVRQRFRIEPGEALDLGDVVLNEGCRIRLSLEAPGASIPRAKANWRRVSENPAVRSSSMDLARIIDGQGEIIALEPGRYIVGLQDFGSPTQLCARLVSVEVTEEADAEARLRLDPRRLLFLQAVGEAALGTRYAIRDEATGLVNKGGTLSAPQPYRIFVPEGPWKLEFTSPSGLRHDRRVFVGPEPITVRVPH